MSAGSASDRGAAGATTRLFLALWPDAAARAALADWRDAWTWPPAARLVAPAQWHVTLHFLGAVPDTRLPALADALAVDASPCTVSFARPASWHGGVAVLEPESTATQDALGPLHARLADVLRAAGLPVEERPWRPHVTLARHAAGARAPDPAGGARWPVRWQAAGHALVASEGGRYRTLRTYAWGDAAGAPGSPVSDAPRG